MDTDAQVLQTASQAVTQIDLRYRLADPMDQLDLGPERDAAFSAYLAARVKLLAQGTTTTAADVTTMNTIKADIDKAADTQTLILVAGRLAAFLAGL